MSKKLMHHDEASYRKLIASIRREILSAKKVIESQQVRMGLNIGRFMKKHLNGQRRRSLAALARDISADTNIHHRTLEDAYRLACAYKKIDYTLGLTWSHYTTLCSITNPQERLRWEKRIVHDGLNHKEFLALLNSKRATELFPDGKSTYNPTRGLLYHYRLVIAPYGLDGKKQIVVDCGFNNVLPPPPSDGKAENKRVIRMDKGPQGYSWVLTNESTDVLYTYAAPVEIVLDGDSLWVNVDCGFGIGRRQELRLNGVDAPEKNTAAGQRAKKWVERALKPCPFVVVRTFKWEKYGRYLADVFYLPHEKDPHIVAAKGLCLNQELLKRGLAVPYDGGKREEEIL